MRKLWSIGIVVALLACGWTAHHYWGLGGKLVVLFVAMGVFLALSSAVLLMRLRLQRELESMASADRRELEQQTDPDDADMLADTPASAWRDFIWDILSVPLALLIVLGPAFVYHIIRYGRFSWNDQMTWVHILMVFASAGIAIGVHAAMKRMKSGPNQAPEDTARKLADPQR
jgi:hypothetical protein